MSKLLLLLGLAGGLMAADLTGKWYGSIQTSASREGIYLDLKLEGERLSGWMSTADGQSKGAIEKAELHGDEVRFEVVDTRQRLLKFHLKIGDHALTGERTAGDEVAPVTFAPAAAAPDADGPDRSTAPLLLRKTEPAPGGSKVQGTVVLKVVIGTDGKVPADRIQVIRSMGEETDRRAIACVTEWTFRPGTRDGKPVAVTATIEVNFRYPD